MTDPAIRVEHISKVFKLPHEKQSSVKGLFVSVFRRKRTFERQLVLNDISFEINKGDFFGIVGRNGSGKSTLLKLLAGIYTPNKGTIHVEGNLTPFIELGVGFNPELTGRENVYLNGALMGFDRKEMNEKYNEIVEFAELEEFMDQKLKNYSSGMQVRLAFSIAIRAKSDILLLDEVLAVGDAAFQKKCLAVFEKYKAEKQTVILVTHDMSIVEKYCDKAILLDKGVIVRSGEPRVVAHLYSDMNTDRYKEYQEQKQQIKQQNDEQVAEKDFNFAVYDEKGKQKKSFMYGDEIIIRMNWDKTKIKNIGVALLTQRGEYVFGANTILEKIDIIGKKLDYKLKLNLGEGEYEFKIGLFGDSEDSAIKFIDEGPSIYVSAPSRSQANWGGITKLEHSWEQ